MKALRALAHRFWEGYHRHYPLVLAVTTGIFLLQLFHLYWLFTDVVLTRLAGSSFFVFPETGLFIYVIADYLEVPALVSTSLLYLYQLRHRVTGRHLLLFALVNTQWVHLLWLTDEIVVEALGRQGLVAWPALVAWVAIGIDYLEVPVIIDTLRKVYVQRRAVLTAVTTLLW